MKQYDSDFRTTQETVVRKNQKFSSDAARITIICALIIGILFLFICTIQNYSIYRSIYTHKLNLAPEKHYAQLKAYEEAGDSYDKDALSPKHIASIEDMRYKLNRLIINYLGIDESQIETFQNETTAHQTIMIEEALNNEQ